MLLAYLYHYLSQYISLIYNHIQIILLTSPSTSESQFDMKMYSHSCANFDYKDWIVPWLPYHHHRNPCERKSSLYIQTWVRCIYVKKSSWGYYVMWFSILIWRGFSLKAQVEISTVNCHFVLKNYYHFYSISLYSSFIVLFWLVRLTSAT